MTFALPMKKTLSILLSIIFLALSLIHFYWVLGGKWGLSSALPADESGIPLLAPSILDTLIVGVALSTLSFLYLTFSGIINLKLPHWMIKITTILVPILFIIRSVGEFHYIGFFKTVTQTDFAQMDTLLFSPLCLVIGLFGIVIKILK